MYVGGYDDLSGLKKLAKKAVKAATAPVKAAVKTVVEPVKATVAALQSGSVGGAVKVATESIKQNLPTVIASPVAPIAVKDNITGGGIWEEVKKAGGILAAPLKEGSMAITHPVRTVKRDAQRIKQSFKGGNPSDPFAAIASVFSHGLRPIDAALRKGGVKGGTARPADLANKKLAGALGTKGKGWAGNKPATIVGALITGGAFAAGGAGAGGAGAGAGGAGGGGTAAAGTGAAGGGGGIIETISSGAKKGKKAADAVKRAKEVADAVSGGSTTSLTPGSGIGAPTVVSEPPPGEQPPANNKTLLYVGGGVALLGLLYIASNRRN